MCRSKYLSIYCMCKTLLTIKNPAKKFHLEGVYNPVGREWRFTY